MSMSKQIELNDIVSPIKDLDSIYMVESIEESNPPYIRDLYKSSYQISLEGIYDIPNDSNNNLNILTGLNNHVPIAYPQQLYQNSNETIKSSSAQKAGSITSNNNQKAQILGLISNNTENGTTKERTNVKKRGRRKKGSTLTGGHTNNFPGNILRKNATGCMDSIYNSLNKRIKIYFPKHKLKRVDFSQQFRYNVDNKRFIQQKLYKILRYRNRKNQLVIKMMIKKKDRIFMYIINCTFEYFYSKYIAEKNKIYFDEKDTYSNCFETLSVIADEKEKSKQFKEDWTKEKFLESSKQFLKEVNGDGKLKYRKRRIPNQASCEYEVVGEIENFFGNQRPYIY